MSYTEKHKNNEINKIEIIMKKYFLLLVFLGMVCITWAKPPKTYTVHPTYADIKYGLHERNVLDLWIAKSDVPTPLVIYVHGGGFSGGSKEKLNMTYLKKMLANGISVVSVNYRYCKGEKDGALASIGDVRRAVQYLRSRSKEWNIDKQHIGMWGGSAGAGATLWIAFHDELADPESDDPVLRESSRLQAACGVAVQSTYDTFPWPALLNISEDSPLMKQLHDNWTPRWLGLKSINDKDTPRGFQMRKDLDIISMITPDDPPFLVFNNAKGTIPPTEFGQMVHHPLFAKMLYEKGKECQIDCRACTPNAPEYGLNDPMIVPDFFIKYLKIY